MKMRDDRVIGRKALIPNPALKGFDFLIGDWETTGTHPQVPGKTLRGRTSFAWHEGGAFIIMHSEIDEPGFPSGIAIIGTDDTQDRFVMVYFDERGTSRIYDVTSGDKEISWRRDDSKIAQTNVIRADDDGDTLINRGRISQSGGDWADDLSQVYRRIQYR